MTAISASNLIEQIELRRINSDNVWQVCELSETLPDSQRDFVADNAYSIAEAYCAPNAWPRAIYYQDDLVGFIMMHIGEDFDDGIACPGAFLWRLMIARDFQGKGLARAALYRVMRDLKARGFSEIRTSHGPGEAGPEGFYRQLGFSPTGKIEEGEHVMRLKFDGLDLGD